MVEPRLPECRAQAAQGSWWELGAASRELLAEPRLLQTERRPAQSGDARLARPRQGHEQLLRVHWSTGPRGPARWRALTSSSTGLSRREPHSRLRRLRRERRAADSTGGRPAPTRSSAASISRAQRPQVKCRLRSLPAVINRSRNAVSSSTRRIPGGDALDVLRIDQQRCASASSWNAVAVRGDDGTPGRHRLEHGQTAGLEERRSSSASASM